MAAAHHDPIELVPGDSWRVPGLLLDVNGAPLDLTSAALRWTLLDPDGFPVPLAADVSVTDAANGALMISVSNTDTAALGPGPYTDALRVSIPGATSTVWMGTIGVLASCF